MAIRFEERLKFGDVSGEAELARLAHVSRVRITQIMNLLFLASDIHKALLFVPPVERGRAAIKLADLQKVALELDCEMRSERLQVFG